MKWLKYVGILALVALIVGAIAAAVVAQGPQPRDRDGTCDCGAQAGDGEQRGWRFNHKRSDGNAPGQGRGRHAGAEPPGDEFVDEDGDGVCDLCGAETPCDEFVDEDGDGVCDLCGAEAGDGEQRGWRFNENENGRGQMGRGRMPCEMHCPNAVRLPGE